jgi:hypothetical protein
VRPVDGDDIVLMRVGAEARAGEGLVEGVRLGHGFADARAVFEDGLLPHVGLDGWPFSMPSDLSIAMMMRSRSWTGSWLITSTNRSQ